MTSVLDLAVRGLQRLSGPPLTPHNVALEVARAAEPAPAGEALVAHVPRRAVAGDTELLEAEVHNLLGRWVACVTTDAPQIHVIPHSPPSRRLMAIDREGTPRHCPILWFDAHRDCWRLGASADAVCEGTNVNFESHTYVLIWESP